MTVAPALTRLGEYLRARRLVIFCGVGIPSGFKDGAPGPQPWWLTSSLTDEERRAQLRVTQPWSAKDASPIHRWLVQLDAQWYVTTSYDRILDSALTEHQGSDQIAVITKDSELPRVRACRTACLKIYGDLDNRDLLVMTRRDYQERVRHPKLVDALLRYLFASHPVLFIATAAELENIIEMWGESDRNFPAPPERYLLQLSQDDERTAYLKQLGVELVLTDTLLPKNWSDRTLPDHIVEGFLHRLWEQTSPFGDFLFHNSGQKASLEEQIGIAIDLRRNGNLEAAEKQLSIIRQTPRIPLNQLPRLLWLTVSLYDKLERMDLLKALEPQITQWLTATSDAPPAVVNAIYAAYYSALSIAHLRALNFDDAWQLASKMQSWCPTEVAQRDFQLLRANALTIYAMVAYCRWVCRNMEHDVLRAAATNLKDADQIYLANPTPPGTESHYRGRYYGTLAFIKTAIALEDNKLDATTIEDIERDAEKAHKNGQDRTKFGRIAGLYCHAYVLSSFAKGDSERRLYASKLLDDALASLPVPNQIARDKIKLLQSKIKGDEANSATIRNKLRSFLASTNMEIEQWLRLPLN